MRIRQASGSDWPGIWAFLSLIVASGETYTYPQELTADEARAIWMEPPPWRTYVAEEAGRVIGSAKLGPNKPGRGSHVATGSFIVDPERSGRGVGRALAEHVMAEARGLGYRSMQFNAVVETNTDAVRLWESLGFEVLATVPEAFDHPRSGPVGLHIMYRAL